MGCVAGANPIPHPLDPRNDADVLGPPTRTAIPSAPKPGATVGVKLTAALELRLSVGDQSDPATYSTFGVRVIVDALMDVEPFFFQPVADVSAETFPVAVPVKDTL